MLARLTRHPSRRRVERRALDTADYQTQAITSDMYQQQSRTRRNPTRMTAPPQPPQPDPTPPTPPEPPDAPEEPEDEDQPEAPDQDNDEDKPAGQ